MLKKITVKNFKCFKNETVFDLRKTNYKFLEQNTCGKLLKGALLVGDHASGKTTILQSIRLLPALLFRQGSCNGMPYQCIFSKENDSGLIYEFDIDGHDLVYSFTFSRDSFVEENLTVDGRAVIERLGKKGKWIAGKETVLWDIEDSQLFLKQVSMNPEISGSEILRQFLAYLKKTIYIDGYTRKIAAFDGESLCAEKYIENYGVEKMNDFFTEYHFPYRLRYCREGEGTGQIFFRREENGGEIPACMESSGNRTLMNLLPAFFRGIESGGMLLIDSFGGGLHNKLEELLVRHVMKKGEKTQLIFASHSTNLLSNTILRPDQIYAVESGKEEGSRLHRFSDEQPRVAQNLEKMYLSGVFGGLPAYRMDDLSTVVMKNE